MTSVEKARVALRDAEIEELVAKRTNSITRHGRCPNSCGHFDLLSFWFGVFVGALIIGIPLSIVIVRH